jgi:hypothetical protein
MCVCVYNDIKINGCSGYLCPVTWSGRPDDDGDLVNLKCRCWILQHVSIQCFILTYYKNVKYLLSSYDKNWCLNNCYLSHTELGDVFRSSDNCGLARCAISSDSSVFSPLCSNAVRCLAVTSPRGTPWRDPSLTAMKNFSISTVL